VSETLESYIRRFAGSEKTKFIAQIRYPVLIDNSYSAGSIAPKHGFRTATIDDENALAHRLRPDQREVFLVRKREEATFSGHIGVGRTSNLDVVIPRTGISKFHAYFSETGAGFQLTDKNSTNGTCVAGKRLLPDTPVLLASEVDVQFANHGFTFLTPARLFELIRSRTP
jgi:pSer/pThr/pTyr-binding forkhead associated (FHA) protein